MRYPDKEYMEDTGMARVTKDTTIGEVIQIDAGVIPILMGAGMHCVGCPSSAGETLEEAAMVHGIDSDMLVEEIQSYLQSLG
jgi:hybrid cluster-associated redox disulfide protein